MTYYDILEISENASDEVIKVAYKALAKKYHPDVCKDDPTFAEEKMKRINEAFEILSNPEKRKQYDIYLYYRKNTNNSNEDKSSEYKDRKHHSPHSQRSSKYPSIKKSCLIIISLLFLCFASVLHPYIDPVMYDYAFLFGITDFFIISTILMIIPILVYVIKRNLTHRDIKKLCAINSISIFAISIILYIFKLVPNVLIGGLGAIAYYFLNIHILLQIDLHAFDFKKLIICLAIIFLVICIIITGNIIFLNNYFNDNSGDANSPTTDNNTPSIQGAYYTDVAGQKYNLEEYGSCIIVRILTYEDKFTAELDYLILKDISDERQLIAEMNQWSLDGNGGRGLVIEHGDLTQEVDSWCFHPNRKVGDIALIENPYGYSICYISAIFTD